MEIHPFPHRPTFAFVFIPILIITFLMPLSSEVDGQQLSSKTAVIPLLCAKPGFYDAYCLPEANPKSIEETWNAFEINMEKLPLKEDLWLHIDISSVADPPIEISEVFVSAFNLLGQPVGRFVDYIPCLDNHKEVYRSSRIDELYLLLTRGGRLIKDGVEMYSCPPVPGLSSDEDPPTQALLKFTEPTKAFYFHYKFTPEEFKSLDKDEDDNPTSGIQVIAVIKDKNNNCYSRLYSKAHYLIDREPAANSLMITEVPLDCHLAKGVLAYEKSSQKQLMMPGLHAEKDSVGYDFVHKHPEIASRLNMPNITGRQDTQALINAYNSGKYNSENVKVKVTGDDDDDEGDKNTKNEENNSKMNGRTGTVIEADNIDSFIDHDVTRKRVDMPPSDVSISVMTPNKTSPEALRKQRLLQQMTTKAPCLASKRDLYLECGHTTGCLGYPKECLKSRTCDYMMSYKRDGDYVKFEIIGETSKWLAIGLSHDSSMGDDSVVECVLEDDLKVNVYMSWNNRFYNNELGNTRVRPSFKNKTQKGVKETKGKFVDGLVHCSFKRHKKTAIYGQDFDLEHHKFYLLFAVGSSAEEGPNGNLNKHHWSYKAANSINFFKPVGRSNSELAYLKTHGSLMILVWMAIVPNATFFARYFKETFVKRSCCGFSIWYMTHTVSMSLTILLTIGSVFAIYSKENSYPGKNGWDFHAGAGIAMMCLLIIQVPLAFLILKFNNRYKYFFINFIHGFQGHFLFFAGYAVTYHSRQKRDGLPCSTDNVLIPYIVFYFLFHLIISYHVCYTDFVQGKSKSRAYTLGPLDIPDRTKDLNKDEPGALGRKIVLGIFLLFTSSFSLSILGIYLTKNNEDCLALSIMKS